MRGPGGTTGGADGRRRGPMRVAEALAGYLSKSGLGERMEAAASVDDWAERVGGGIADVTEPLHVTDGVLLVAVRSSAWLTELRMMEKEIRRRMNEGREKGRIDRIRFVMSGGEEPGSGGEGRDRPGSAGRWPSRR